MRARRGDGGASIQDLPEDLLELIARSLDSKTLCTWRHVCSRFWRVGNAAVDALTFQLKWNQQQVWWPRWLVAAVRQLFLGSR